MRNAPRGRAVVKLVLKLSLAVIQVLAIWLSWGSFPAWFVLLLSAVAAYIVFFAVREYRRDVARVDPGGPRPG